MNIKYLTYSPNICIVGIIFFVSPLLSLPFVLRSIYDRQKGSFFLFSLFMGLLAFLTPPFADLYRHYDNYLFWEGLHWDDWSWELLFLNGLIQVPYMLFVNNGISFEYVRLMELFFGYLVMSHIFNDIIRNSQREYSKIDIFIRFIILLFTINFFYTVLGVRFGFALCLYSLAIYKLIQKKEVLSGFILWLLSIGWHLGIGLFSIPAYVLYKIKLSGKKTLIFFVICAFFINTIIAVLSPLTAGRSEWYFSGDGNSATSYGQMSFAGLVLTLAGLVSQAPLFFHIFKTDMTTKMKKISISWTIISVSFITNAVVFGRAYWGSTYIALICFFIMDSIKITPPRSVRYILCGALMAFLINVLSYRYGAINYYKTIFPLPYVLNHHYNDSWINKNIDSETGNFKE